MIRPAALLIALLFLALTGLAQEESRNRLGEEKSPYLRQHAENPVHWWPWCDEAFAEAKKRGVPVFLSIGYSTCHWCHVMEHESFEDEEVAKYLNEHFVCIKVDREERPDVDAVYMKVINAMTGRGGWPASLLLTPGREAFWGGTYLPRDNFLGLLKRVTELWSKDRKGLEENAADILVALIAAEKRAALKELPPEELLTHFVNNLAEEYDEEHGGFSGAPKFPRIATLRLLLRSRDERGPAMVWNTLKEIAHGGIHDHLAGGLHRYAVDAKWKVPHFEKMLYDQALALDAYLDLGLQCREERAYEMARDIADCLLRDFRGEGGAFVSAFDADTEGIEGKTYVWTRKEIEDALDGDEERVVLDRFEILTDGNWAEAEGMKKVNVLVVEHHRAESAKRLEMKEGELVTHWRSARSKLLALRAQRAQPGRDDKIITGWNGLAIGALARAGRVLGRAEYVVAAREAAVFLDENLRDEKGRLLRRFIDGEAAHQAVLQDHAYLAMGLIELFLADLDPRWLKRADELAQAMMRDFADEDGALHDAPARADLVMRPRDGFDGARPSPNGVACQAFMRLAGLLGKKEYRAAAEKQLKAFGQLIERFPASHASLLTALELRLSERREILLIGSPDRLDLVPMRELLRRSYLPRDEVLILAPEDVDRIAELVPWVKGKTAGEKGAPRAYVCRAGVCKLPVRTAPTLREALSEN